MHKPMAMLRYICQANKGKNGECMYPANQDPDLHWKIENCVEILSGDFGNKIGSFCVPTHPDYANKDQNFINFIAKDLPDVLEQLETMLNKCNTKYLVDNCMTMADILFSTFLFMLPFNDVYPNQHIVEAVIRKYPKTCCLAECLKSDFEFMMKK